MKLKLLKPHALFSLDDYSKNPNSQFTYIHLFDIINVSIYSLPPTRLREDNVFTVVCLSSCGGSLSPQMETPLEGRPIWRESSLVLTFGAGHQSGLQASYWNAFLYDECTLLHCEDLIKYRIYFIFSHFFLNTDCVLDWLKATQTSICLALIAQVGSVVCLALLTCASRLPEKLMKIVSLVFLGIASMRMTQYFIGPLLSIFIIF